MRSVDLAQLGRGSVMGEASRDRDRTWSRSSVNAAAAGHRGNRVLGRSLRPVAEAAGHEFAMPGREELDLFDPSAVAEAVRGLDGVLHLATQIRSFEQLSDPEAWRENHRLRADASRILVDAALAAGLQVYVQPTVTFVYPADGPSPRTPPSARSCRSWGPRWTPSGRPRASHAREAEASCCDWGCSTARDLVDEPMGDFGATLHSPMLRVRSSRRCRCPAGSTTCAVTGSGCRRNV